MSDHGDFCRDMRDHRRAQKDKWRSGGMKEEIAMAEKISKNFQTNNEGEHLILEIETDRGLRIVDFWPSTKKWKSRSGKASGYGVRNIISYFKLKT